MPYTNKLAIRDAGPEVQNIIIGIIGRKGTGKSTVSREILKHGSREFIFDTAGDHSWVPDRFTEIDQAVNFIFECATQGGEFIGSFVPEGEEDEDLQRDFGEICKVVWESGNITFVVEELPMLSLPQWAPPRFDRILRLGRHRAINIVYTAQRASECPKRATSATDLFILFHTSEPPDLDRIAERCGNECADLVRNLGDHEFVVFDVRQKSLIEIDGRWYDLVLTETTHTYTPAVGGRSGRSALWSLSDAE